MLTFIHHPLLRQYFNDINSKYLANHDLLSQLALQCHFIQEKYQYNAKLKEFRNTWNSICDNDIDNYISFENDKKYNLGMITKIIDRKLNNTSGYSPFIVYRSTPYKLFKASAETMRITNSELTTNAKYDTNYFYNPTPIGGLFENEKNDKILYKYMFYNDNEETCYLGFISPFNMWKEVSRDTENNITVIRLCKVYEIDPFDSNLCRDYINKVGLDTVINKMNLLLSATSS